MAYFRSFRPRRQARPDRSPEAQQAEMNLDAESHITDRYWRRLAACQTRSSRPSRTSFRMPVTKGISSFV